MESTGGASSSWDFVIPGPGRGGGGVTWGTLVCHGWPLGHKERYCTSPLHWDGIWIHVYMNMSERELAIDILLQGLLKLDSVTGISRS